LKFVYKFLTLTEFFGTDWSNRLSSAQCPTADILLARASQRSWTDVFRT